MEVVRTRTCGRFGHYYGILLAVVVILAVVLVGIILWLCLFGFQLSIQNIMLTAGFLIALCLTLMASIDLVVMGCGLWTLYLVFYH